ncbi:MAG: type VI secretion system baseplate subunit TssF [Shewanella sp.]|nr:type VI secretion system baseplate subunit TssF [Shewanella sp.]MCF1456854.1 type VI secretion system baseplate subunit TssF [Shewanella sp.]
MSDPLLRYYEQELTFVRRALGQFGSAHPEHAQRLNIHQGQIEDPSLARLLDGVALLNAKAEKRLSEQIPEVVEGLLGVLYPSYIQTVPSVAYLEMTTDAPSTDSATLPKGTRFSSVSQGKTCLFTTADELKTTPFMLIDTKASSAPFNFNRPKGSEHTTAVIQLTLSTGDDDVHFSQLALEDLDFFVQGFENNADSLVELLLSETRAISVSDINGENHAVLPANQLKSRISDKQFQFLPQKGNQFSGYHLMNEFFFFKEKRQFFRLKGFGEACQQHDCSSVVLNLFMHSLPMEFIRLFDNQVFKLNVVPAMNLFEQTGEPTSYDQRSLTIPVNADAHTDNEIQVIDILDVFEITSSGQKLLTPLFKDSYQSDPHCDYWQSRKDFTGELRLAISLNTNQELEFNKLYGTRLLCSNGKQACTISGEMTCLEPIDLPGDFHALYPPSAPIERESDVNMHWQFIGLLNSNFSSLLHCEDPTQQLKQMLQLCTRNQLVSDEIQMIQSVKVRSQVSSMRLLGKNVFSPGTEIEITLDTSGNYLTFTDVLDRFFQQFCSFDRYIQLTIRLYGKDGIARCYPRIHGSQRSM